MTEKELINEIAQEIRMQYYGLTRFDTRSRGWSEDLANSILSIIRRFGYIDIDDILSFLPEGWPMPLGFEELIRQIKKRRML